MNPISARFAGTCARTGQAYPAGALIVKLANGKWALAQTQSGDIKTAPDYRLVRLNSGNERKVDINLPSYCKNCVEADGYTRDSLPENIRSNYARTRVGERLVCQRCGSAWEIISDTEIAQRQRQAESARNEAIRLDREQNLKLQRRVSLYGSPGLELSHHLDPPQWKLVKQYFSYYSADDLDQMDYFDMGGGYFTSAANAEAIEAALGIRPENTLANHEERERLEKEAAITAWEAKNPDKFRTEKSTYASSRYQNRISIRPCANMAECGGLESIASYSIDTDTIEWDGLHPDHRPAVEAAFRKWLMQGERI